MTFNEKLEQFNQAIEAAATSLGLEFVDGPNTTSVPLQQIGGFNPSISRTQGQRRGVYLFAVTTE